MEAGFVALLFAVALFLPFLDLLARGMFKSGVPGTYGYVQNLVIWIGFLGAGLGVSEGAHLSFMPGRGHQNPADRGWVRHLSLLVCVTVVFGLTWSAAHFVASEQDSDLRVANWIPVWVVELALPIGFAIMGARLLWSISGMSGRLLASVLAIALLTAGYFAPALVSETKWVGLAGIIVATIAGAPIFVLLGGAALLLFAADGVPVAAVATETYRIATSPLIPALPAFTLTGFLLAESRAGERLTAAFLALFGAIPGGLAIVVVLTSAFLTTFTGGSGITLLAAGGLMYPMLVRGGYQDRFSLGLVTASGSIGLLFPPSVAVILYAVVSHVPIPDLFLAAAMPGVLMVMAVAGTGIYAAWKQALPRTHMEAAEILKSLGAAKWELGLPVIAIGAVWGGFATLVEAASITAIYTIFVECVIHREISLLRDVPNVLAKTAILFGSIFVILCTAMGLTNYLVDAEIPKMLSTWVTLHVESRVLFLLYLNIFLILVGCLMDIFSAIIVVVPLLMPIAEGFGITPIHLAVIFLINLELGYMTPPVGMNLLLAAMRFDKPILEIFRAVLPFTLVFLGIITVVTYAPWLLVLRH